MKSNENFSDLVLEINKLGEELSKIKTETGLLMHQNKIQSIYEKFIFFKTLQNEKLNLANFRREPGKESFDYLNESEKIENTSEIPQKETIQLVDVEPNITFETVEKNNSIQEIEQEIKQELIAERVEEPKKINKIILAEPKKNLPKIQLTLNDRIAFIAQLFGEAEKCTAAIEALNHLDNKEDSLKLFYELNEKFNWKNKMEFSDRLKELIENRFN